MLKKKIITPSCLNVKTDKIAKTMKSIKVKELLKTSKQNKRSKDKKFYIDKLDLMSFGQIRKGFGEGLLKAGNDNSNICALCCDLTESLKVDSFAKKYPERFFEFGISEQNMMSAGAGMCLNGKIPFVVSYAAFNPGRNWDQLRVSICYQNSNVKIIGGHAGLTTGPDGATHQMLEDIAITRCLPNLKIIVPCDEEEARKATIEISKEEGPVYLRLSREKSLNITRSSSKFEIGKVNVLDKGDDVTIIASGICVQFALKAKKELFEKYKIDATVLNLHTIKPLDKETILKYAKKTGAVVTIEEHQKMGGMGSCVCEFLCENYIVPIEIIGVEDSFGESGGGYELLEEYNVSEKEIIKRVLKVIKRKQ